MGSNLRAFQYGAFQVNAFQEISTVSTATLQLPVNCVLIGDQLYNKTGRTFERMAGKAGKRVIASAGGGGRLSDDAPGFTVFTSGRGY